MGTNFYWHLDEVTLPTGKVARVLDVDTHIGKRSAAGWFCWDCDTTLCASGSDSIHASTSAWHDTCPSCGAGKATEPLDASSAGVELGFAKPRSARPKGVRSCSSFSWAQAPEMVGTACRELADKQVVEDEYGRLLTGQEFLDMLQHNCPVQFTDSIGVDFT